MIFILCLAENDNSYVQNLRKSVREAALSLRSCNSVSSRDSHSDESSEHFFAPLSETGFSHLDAERKAASRKASSLRSKRLFLSQMDESLLTSDGQEERKLDDFPDMLNEFERLSDYDNVNGFLSLTGSNATSDAQQSVYDYEDAEDQVFSPPLLMDSSLLADSFEDLLGMLSLQPVLIIAS